MLQKNGLNSKKKIQLILLYQLQQYKLEVEKFSPRHSCLKWAGHGIVNTQSWPGEHGVEHLSSLVFS